MTTEHSQAVTRSRSTPTRENRTRSVARLRPALAALAAAGLAGAGTPVFAGVDPPPRSGAQKSVYLPKPTPPNGDVAPFLPRGSARRKAAPTVGVIGDSVARDYAYYLARDLGPRGVRIVDGAIPSCPAGTLSLVWHSRAGDLIPRSGDCPEMVEKKQSSLMKKFHPKVVMWHSIVELYDIIDARGKIPWGGAEWKRRVVADWDDTLERVTRRGARVVLILPIWFQGRGPVPDTSPRPSIAKLRNLYAQWAKDHRDKVTVVDPAPVICPGGPRCGLVNGASYRPDSTHFADAGGSLAAAYLRTHVPILRRLAARSRLDAHG